MLCIEKSDSDNYRPLKHGRGVFHEALKWVLKGEYRFRVEDGERLTYDLVYRDNNTLFSEANPFQGKMPGIMLPPYLTYDEAAADTLSLETLDGYDEVIFEEANEYSIVAAELVLRHTDKRVTFTDARVEWFLPSSQRLRVAAEGEARGASAFVCCREYGVLGGLLTGNDSVMSPQPLFHSIFLWQWMCELPLSQVRYASVPVMKTEGIGAVLGHFMRMKNFFAGRGIRTYLQEGCTRFNDAMLRRLFHFEKLPEDADETNTIYLYNFVALRMSDPFYKSDGSVTMDMLNRDFIAQIEEYYQAVFGEEKVLGVLIRGTDYISLKLNGIRRQATPEEMIPVIDQWMCEEGFDRIFLATEDADILDSMRAHYGKKLVAVSQKRFRVSDFKAGQFLSDVEKEQDPEEYEASVEDTMVNYYYALVILSKCAAFMASGHVNAWDVVLALNGGRFLRTWKYSAE